MASKRKATGRKARAAARPRSTRPRRARAAPKAPSSRAPATARKAPSSRAPATARKPRPTRPSADRDRADEARGAAGRATATRPAARPKAPTIDHPSPPRRPGEVRYWLFKTEPEVYSWEDLVRDGRTHWDGIRNAWARNLLRDEVKEGDGVLFYHSNANPMCVAGTARVAREAYPDHTAWDPRSPYHDPRSSPEAPIWLMVDLVPERAFPRPVARKDIQALAACSDMMLLARGARLSVQPVAKKEWDAIVAAGAGTA